MVSGAKHPGSQASTAPLGKRSSVYVLMRLTGTAVRMGAHRLRDRYLSKDMARSYTRVMVDDSLAGHAFACRWKYDGEIVC